MGILPAFTETYRAKHGDLFLQGEDLAAVEREAKQEQERAGKRSRRTAGDLKSKKQRH